MQLLRFTETAGYRSTQRRILMAARPVASNSYLVQKSVVSLFDMPCEILNTQNGTVTIRISGKLKRTELARAEETAIECMQSQGKIRLLLLTENFQGWDKTGDWGDLSFQARYDTHIDKIAIVGEQRWQELAEAFVGKGRRSIDIRYFTPMQAALARVWISQTARSRRRLES